jgi:hypothetical protein
MKAILLTTLTALSIGSSVAAYPIQPPPPATWSPVASSLNYPGKHASPWTLKHPVGQGSPLGDKFNHEVYVGGYLDFQNYTQRYNLHVILFEQPADFNPNFLAPTAINDRFWTSATTSHPNPLWAICMEASVHYSEVVCIATNAAGEPLDSRILDERYRRQAAQYFHKHADYTNYRDD